MTCSAVINEGSSHTLNIAFFDQDGVAMTPSSASYEVLCLTTETVVRASTALAPLASSVDLLLDATDNALQDSVTNDTEKRRVVVTSANADSEPYVDAYDYFLKRVGL